MGELHDAGSRTEVVLPGTASLEAFGPGLEDLTRRAPSAHTDLAQGRTLAPRLRAFWR